MLLASERHSVADLESWKRLEDQAVVHAQMKLFKNHVTRARDALIAFETNQRCYAGVSWGKDSVVLADLVYRVAREAPLVWVRVEPVKNPDCEVVRDAFLRGHPGARYEEIEVQCEREPEKNWWHVRGTLERGFAIAERRFGARHVSGIRADESGIRTLRMRKHGEVTGNTCAPIGWWDAWDVWAYLTTLYLPVHPAYACSMDGLLEQGRIRVASLGGAKGTGHGRAEWETRYYGRELAELQKGKL
jgi:phosphoadenosine phosphosulfate reductase